jgi:hypothetical protein
MILVSYWCDGKRFGMLAFREVPGECPQALGGFGPGQEPGTERLLTVVQTDSSTRELSGWVHPDDLTEVNGF